MDIRRRIAGSLFIAFFLLAVRSLRAQPHPATAVGLPCYTCHTPDHAVFLRTVPSPGSLVAAVSHSARAQASEVTRVEADVFSRFPSLRESAGAPMSLERGAELVGGRSISGVRTRRLAAEPVSNGPGFLFPERYDEPFVVWGGRQRVALRALNGLPARADAAGGHVAYENAHDGVDSLHLPRASGSEELLLLRSEASARVFDYEIIEMQGVSRVALQDGAVRFLADPGPPAGFAPIGGTLEIARPWVVDFQGRRTESAARWEVRNSAAGEPLRLRLIVDPSGLEFPLVVDPSFTITGTMSTVRGDHSATLLGNGKVLIAGGLVTLDAATASAELYDPATGRFSPTGSLGTARFWQGSSILTSGKVLLAGGFNTNHLASAEVYDPTGGTFSPTGGMGTPRTYPLTVLLTSGKVLVAGGFNGTFLATAELYDPATGTFSATGSMSTPRFWATATRLSDGRVLVAGGFTGAAHLATAEIYNPATGTFAPVGAPMTSSRSSHVAALLPDGRVFLGEGFDGTSDSTLAYPPSAEIFNPATNTFTPTGPLVQGRFKAYATVLPDGRCLLAGGSFANESSSGYQADNLKTEIYNPATNTSADTGVVLFARRLRASVTLLPNGSVLFVGGYGHTFVLQSSSEEYRPAVSAILPQALPPATSFFGPVVVLADLRVAILTTPTASIFDVSTGTFSQIPFSFLGSNATLLPDGRVFLSGGSSGATALFNPPTGTVSPVPQSTAPLYGFSATLLRSGRVLLAGGTDPLNFNDSRTALEFDPATGLLTPVGPMNVRRANHAATLLADGRVLVTGGSHETVRYNSAEIFDPVSGTFTLLPTAMAWPRESHQTTLLPDGRVLITGGDKGLSSTNTAELFDPATQTFTLTAGLMSIPRQYHSATLLPSGRVLIAGGQNYQGATNDPVDSVEVFDPTTGTFQPPIPAPLLGTLFDINLAGLLPDGRVLLVGPDNTVAYRFDEGLAYPDARRPTFVSWTSGLFQPTPLAVQGSGFHAPLVQMQRVDNGQQFFLSPDPASNWSNTSFTSSLLSGLAAGLYRLTVFGDAVPSLQRFVSIFAWDPQAPSIVGQPGSQTVLPGGSATLAVVAAGAPTLAYQWSTETSPGVFSPVPGATSSTLPTGVLASRKVYRVTVTNGFGSVTSVPAVVSIGSDTCANATLVTALPFSGTQSTVSATIDASDPVQPCGFGGQGKSVWYRYTPVADGVLTANTFGSDYDTVLSVWTGSCGAFVLVPFACNDNYIVSQSKVSFSATAGTTYLFMVSAPSFDGGDLIFSLTSNAAQNLAASALHTLTPCRIIDTRQANGPLAGPNLLPSPAPDRIFPVLTSACGVPATAKSLAVNVTVTQPTAIGSLLLYPGNLATAPVATTISFSAGQTRANNAMVGLSTDGLGNLAVKNGSSGTVAFILDVTGYFQ